MRRVRGKDTSCEVLLRSALHRRGLRDRLHARLPGRPDVVLPRAKVSVFVDGCFWHGCPEHCRVPTGNRKYWEAKIARNRARDERATDALRAEGWAVIRVWEHEVRDPDALARTVARVERAVRRVS